jgi:hypothetical protein
VSIALVAFFNSFSTSSKSTSVRRTSSATAAFLILIDEQRTIATSTNVAVSFRTLWSAALLDYHLEQCADAEISQLLIVVQEHRHIFEPEFAIWEHAKCRLLLRSAKERPT